ncbi:MAG: hypothetical protein QM710_13895 [Flavobacterium sp.]
MTQNRSIPIFFLLMLAASAAFGQSRIAVKQLDLADIPKEITYEGAIKKAVRWIDGLGDNIVILTETGIYQNEKFKHENDGGDAELFAYHFIVKEGSASLAWRVYDYISDCPVDIEAQFINGTFQVTDINNDGIGEIWMMYRTVCHGDVSPSNMKIIMYQGQQKFALRGYSKVVIGIDKKGIKHYEGGDYKHDQAFAEGPKEFLAFAKKLWKENIMQKWGE